MARKSPHHWPARGCAGGHMRRCRRYFLIVLLHFVRRDQPPSQTSAPAPYSRGCELPQSAWCSLAMTVNDHAFRRRDRTRIVWRGRQPVENCAGSVSRVGNRDEFLHGRAMRSGPESTWNRQASRKRAIHVARHDGAGKIRAMPQQPDRPVRSSVLAICARYPRDDC